MADRRTKHTVPQADPFRVRLPGFLRDEDIGLGEFVSRVTSALGVPPCGDCKRRAERLDRLVVLSGRRRT